MAVPTSGELSLGKIRQELQTSNYAGGPYTVAATSLDDAENGTIATINTCSAYFPISTNPANMSEWYRYDHDAACPCFGNASSLDLVTNYVSALTGSSNWSTAVGDGRFLPDGALTINWWVKNDAGFTQTNSTSISYFVLTGEVTYAGVSSTYDGTIYLWGNINATLGGNYLEFAFVVSEPGGTVPLFVRSRCYLGELNGNLDTTGVTPDQDWDSNNTGNKNNNGFSMLTIVYDYANYENDDYIRWYWNGIKLTVPYFDPGPPYEESHTYSYLDPPLSMTWGDACATIGSNIMACSGGYAEIGMHQLLDEFSMWGSAALGGSDITELYTGLTYQSVPGGVKTLCVGEMATNLTAGAPDLHYAFETGSTLGYPYGANYQMGYWGTPIQSSDNA